MDGTPGVSAPARGVTARVLTAWADLRGAMRAVLADRPGEATLFVFALLSGLLRFFGRLAELWLGQGGAGLARDALLSRIAAEFAGALVFRTLALYAVAVALWGAARAFGGTGGAYESRAALFWSALVAAPVMLAVSLAATLAAPAIGAEAVAWLRQIGVLAFAVALAAAIAEAHGFRRPLAVFAVMAGLIGALAAALRLAAAGGS